MAGCRRPEGESPRASTSRARPPGVVQSSCDVGRLSATRLSRGRDHCLSSSLLGKEDVEIRRNVSSRGVVPKYGATSCGSVRGQRLPRHDPISRSSRALRRGYRRPNTARYLIRTSNFDPGPEAVAPRRLFPSIAGPHSRCLAGASRRVPGYEFHLSITPRQLRGRPLRVLPRV